MSEIDTRLQPWQWVRLLAEDMSLFERIHMRSDGRYTQDEIVDEVQAYADRIEWYLRKAGIDLPSPPNPQDQGSERT